MTLRIILSDLRSNGDSDWGRDTQIIVDLILSPDKTLSNPSRLSGQARDGSGVALILSAFIPSLLVLTV
jgi:hypothetical protein